MNKPLTSIRQAYDWLDERTGVKHAVHRLCSEPIRGGARWSYVFGSSLVFLFLLQAVTGIFLALYYVPSSDHAHASVTYIQKAVPGGALLRGLHYYGASAMVILILVHLAQTFLFGAYKRKRELLWVSGVVMALLILGFAFTGYLLPWDQTAYFGTEVGTSVMKEFPLVGPLIQRIMLAGTQLSSLTLSRFFTLHAFLLPLATGLLIAFHIYLFRRSGPAGPYHERDNRRVERFYPRQLLKDMVFIWIVFCVLVALAYGWPAELGPPADPASQYLARPAWYFLPLFQLLKYFPGKLVLIPTVVVPGVVSALLFLLPFIDRRATLHPARRPVAVGAFAVMLLLTIALGMLAKYDDRADPQVRDTLARQEQEAQIFAQTPFRPQELATATTTTANNAAPPEAFLIHCARCHGKWANGDTGPPLAGITLRPNRRPADLLKILDNPRAYKLEDPMPDSFPTLTNEDKRKLVAWINGLKAVEE